MGRGTCAIDLRGIRVRPMTPSAPTGSRAPADLIGRALDTPLEGRPLTELCAGRQDAVVVVPDGTRGVDLPVILPQVLKRLRRGGIEDRDVTILVACGTHPPMSAEDLRGFLGRLPVGVAASQHAARDADSLVTVGTVVGRPIRINRLAAEAGLLITVSEVKHHYFAGFGGGPKMIFPGVAGYDEIQANHSRVIDDPGGEVARNPRCEPGVLAGNPVAEEIAAAADLRPPDMAVCLVLGANRGVARVMAGSWRSAFSGAVETVRAWYEVPARDPFELAVASGGGTPADSTLIQAHKSMDAACRFLADGGELLYVADLSLGPGSPDMEPFLAEPTPGEILRRLAEGWIQYGHTTLRLVERTERVRIHLVSNLDPTLARRLGFEPASDPREVVESWRRTHAGKTVAVFGGAPVYPRTTTS